MRIEKRTKELRLWSLHGVGAEKRPGAGADTALYVGICKTKTNKQKKTINDKLKQDIVAASLYPHSNKYILKTKQH